MATRSYILFFSIFMTISLTIHAKNSKLIPIPPVVSKQIRNTGNFTQIEAKGRINIQLHTGYKKPQVILTGKSRDIAQVKTMVIQDTLYLLYVNVYPSSGEVTAEIRGKSLSGFRYAGIGYINGTKLYSNALNLTIDNPGTSRLAGCLGLREVAIIGNGSTQISGIHSHYMTLRMKGNPKLELSGEVNLADLDISGNGRVSLDGVKSDYLKIRADQRASIQLGGIANRLDVELWGHAHFNGRYLRVHRSFAKTHDRSFAEISSSWRQSTLATDASDIFYYNLPETRADFMAFNGAVLDLRAWDDPFIEDFTIYNKQFP